MGLAMSSTFETLKSLFQSEMGISPDKITPDTKIKELIPDKYDLEGFELALEEAFLTGVEFDENFSHVSTIGELAAAIDKVKP